MPDSFAEADNGILLIANGINRMLRWDGLSDQASPAGVDPPLTAPTLAGNGQGAIIGTYAAFVRFVDRDGNFSNLSPLSEVIDVAFAGGNLVGVKVWDFAAIDALAHEGGSGSTLATLATLINTPVEVTTALAHGLASGSKVRLELVGGSTQINGVWEIIISGPKTFRLVGLKTASTYAGGGLWNAGVERIEYSTVPVPQSPRIRRRQILRNTDGQSAVFYVDIDTDDLASTEGFVSTLDDTFLSAQEAVPLLDNDGAPLANRFTVPPNHKAVLASHLGRMFAAVDVVYAEGCLDIRTGQRLVTGIGTEWTPEMAGRVLYLIGAKRSYQIDVVDPAAQTLTLLDPYAGTSNPFALYAIRPAPGEAKLVYYSEPGLPEAWPATNALSVPSDSDDITGLSVSGSFLYILEKTHVYRFTFQGDPAVDGYIFPSLVGRGCLNNRCWVEVDGYLYMMDEKGIYKFEGGADIEANSMAIQDIFRTQDGKYAINWKASKFFHAVHSATQETVRWFVALSGDYLPRHALCFNYRLKRWWIEEFQAPIGASCLATINGLPVVLLGSYGRHVNKFWEGGLDGPRADEGTVRGTVTASSLCSLTDDQARFAANRLAGSPVAIVAGKGKGQVRLVDRVEGTTIWVALPWLDVPDDTSVYQLGAVGWRWRSGSYRFVNEENLNPRRVEVIFNPVTLPCLIDLRIFRDQLTDPERFAASQSSVAGDGFKSVAGSQDLTMDMTKPTGYVMKRFSAHKELNADGTRFWALELSGFANDESVIVGDLTLQGAIERGER